MVPKIRVPLLLLALLVSRPAAWGWGNDGHVSVNRVAAEKLPPDVPLFLRSAVAELAYLGPEPDRWRDSSDAALTSIQAAEAKHHVGERATVCGKAASAHYATKTRGSPTFLNLDKPYPNQIFTVPIWGSDRSKFGDPEQTFRNQHICATGKITDYKGIPEIIVSEPSQIKLQ